MARDRENIHAAAHRAGVGNICGRHPTIEGARFAQASQMGAANRKTGEGPPTIEDGQDGAEDITAGLPDCPGSIVADISRLAEGASVHADEGDDDVLGAGCEGYAG